MDLPICPFAVSFPSSSDAYAKGAPSNGAATRVIFPLLPIPIVIS